MCSEMEPRGNLAGGRPCREERHNGHRILARALALVCSSLTLLVGCHSPEEAPNVLLISIDTLRADHLGSYGHGRNISPNLDRLAAEGVRFSSAISHSPWTTPSHMSLMTSLHPSSHTVTQGWPEFVRFRDQRGGYRILPEGITTLAELLQSNGYYTRALTGGRTVGGNLGFDRGFDEYVDGSPKLQPSTWSQLVTWISDPTLRPLFLFFHTFEVHAPYLRTSDVLPLLSPEAGQALEAFIESDPDMSEGKLKKYLMDNELFRPEITSRLYDGGIRSTDWFLGRLFDELNRLDLWDETVIVVTSDHGEEFADHRPRKFYGVHCDTLYDELIHVPLIFRAPGRFTEGRVVRRQVSLVDVAPTLLELVDIPIPSQMQGTSLIAWMESDDEPTPSSRTFSEALCVGPEWKSLRTERYKYIVGFEEKKERTGIPGEPEWEKLFDLKKDPEEKTNLASLNAPLLKGMRSRLFNFFLREVIPQGTGERRLEVDPQLEQQLRALGYLD